MSTRALVTGGSGGIGRAICLALGAAGFEVMVHGCRHMDRAEVVAQAIRDEGGKADALCFDVTNAEQTRLALERLQPAGPIQVLVNNAGLYDDAPMAGMTGEQWQRVIDVSLNGFFNVTQPLLLPMIRTRWGRIVTITSISGLIGNRGQVNYAAAKAGLHGATKALALELASRHITVNAVAPGIISTPATKDTFSADAIDRLVPMKRAGTVEEVAGLVSFLVSDSAAYISGQILSVNGAQA